MKRIVFTTLLICILSLYCDSQNSTDTSIYEYTYAIRIDFKLTQLKPQAIIYSIVDFDPIEKYVEKFDLDLLNEHLKGVTDEDKIASIYNTSFWSWNQLFHEIDGTQISLLTSEGANKYIAVRKSKDKDVISQPITKKWILSKAFLLKGKLCCYAVPIEPKKNEKIEVILDNNNLIILNDLYNEKIK